MHIIYTPHQHQYTLLVERTHEYLYVILAYVELVYGVCHLTLFVILELDLQCCTHLRVDALLFIGDLSQLRRLNLYSMHIGEELLTTIGK